jgi:hypothetical protein
LVIDESTTCAECKRDADDLVEKAIDLINLTDQADDEDSSGDSEMIELLDQMIAALGRWKIRHHEKL